jgi:ABC-type polysaccharide/polyol phosphate transport system ATPase subunit
MSRIVFKDVWEKYRVRFAKDAKVAWEEFWALQDVSFSVEEGEVLGIIGSNGAGKTTLLKLIAGMLLPDKGEVRAQGRVSTLMELGAGFNPEFTGRENILLNARTYGMQESVLSRQMESAIEFADIGKFIDAPMKYYSLGMYARLAFALAVFVEPDILLIDDVLAVGDEEARLKCGKKIFELKNRGKTMVVVSHDMEMVRQLCDRVILIKEGRIVRQGDAAAVISYYLETIGPNAGIAVLESGDLRLIFNNGRVALRCGDRILTKFPGIYLSFFDPSLNVWHPSSSFLWKIKEKSPDKIVAQGYSLDGALNQEWLIESAENAIHSSIKVFNKNMKQAHLDLIFSPQYSGWTTLGRQGEFPAFTLKNDWQNLFIDDFTGGFFGLISSGEERLSCVLLHSDRKDNRMEILNTGYDQEGRVVQIFSDKEDCVSFDLELFKGAKSLLERVRQQEIQEKTSVVQDSVAWKDMCLFVDRKNKAIRLFYKESELTGPKGISSAFRIDQQWFHPGAASWEIKKEGEEELILSLRFDALGLTQTWVFSLADQGVLSFKVMMSLSRSLKFSNQAIQVELGDFYRIWKTPFESGTFLIKQDYERNYPIRWKNNKASCVVFESADEKKYPHFSFVSFSHPGARVTDLYKNKETGFVSVVLSSALIIPKKDELTQSGQYVFFEGKISLGNLTQPKEEAAGEVVELRQGSLRFVFDNGKGRIYAGQKELTSGLCAYTSVRSSNSWVDSSQALWQIEEKKENKVVLKGYWPHLPLSQRWTIEVKDKGRVTWDVETQIHEETGLEIEQANLMLSDAYVDWTAAQHSGNFSNEFTEDYDILPFRFWYGHSEQIEAMGDGLPRIIFRTVGSRGSLRGLVENTDTLYRARLLQFQKANAKKSAPGKYVFLKGVIEVEL